MAKKSKKKKAKPEQEPLPGWLRRDESDEQVLVVSEGVDETPQRAVFRASFDNPKTVLPLSGSACALIWGLAAGSPIGFGLACALGAIGAGSFAYQYFVQGPATLPVHKERIDRSRRQRAVSQIKVIETEFLQLGFADGVKSARELARSYESLIEFFDGAAQRSEEFEPFQALADESVQEGIHLLEVLLSTYKAVESVDVETLKAEVSEWDALLRQKGSDLQKRAGIKAQIESHMTRLTLAEQASQTMDKLLIHINEIEATLQTTLLELTDLQTTCIRDRLSESGALGRLRDAVRIARELDRGNFDRGLDQGTLISLKSKKTDNA